MEDKLILIPSLDLPKLRDLYLADWPRNQVGFNTVDTFVRWQYRSDLIDQRPDLENLDVFSLNGDWSDGTFVCIYRRNWLFLNSLNPSIDRLRSALLLLDWSVGFNVSSVEERFRPIFTDIIELRQLTICSDDRLMVFYLPQEKTIKTDLVCPDNVTLGSLNVRHASLINSKWHIRYDVSDELLAQLIELNPNVGAFDSKGNLIAWCLRLETGLLGSMFVHESYRRFGLGSLLCKVMSRKAADLNLDAITFILPENEPSQRMFAKMGFQYLSDIYWLHTVPTTNE